MKDTTIRRHVNNAYYSYKLMRVYENMENSIAEELYENEEKNLKKHLSAVGIKKNERTEAVNVFEGWYKELTDEELKDIKEDAERLLSSIEDMRRELPELLKKAEAEAEELRELSQTELYDAYVYMRDHKDERTQLTYAARIFVDFELQCRRDEEELRGKLEHAYELGFKGRDEDPDVICFLWDEIDSGRTAEAERLIEEYKELKEEENTMTTTEERREAIERLKEIDTITPYTDDKIEEIREITWGLNIDEIEEDFEDIWDAETMFEYIKEIADDIDSMIYLLEDCSPRYNYYYRDGYGNFRNIYPADLNMLIDCIIMSIEQAE